MEKVWKSLCLPLPFFFFFWVSASCLPWWPCCASWSLDSSVSVTLLQSIFTERTLCGFTLNIDPLVAGLPTQHWAYRRMQRPGLPQPDGCICACAAAALELRGSCSSLVPQGPSLPVWDPHLHLQCFLQLAQKVSLSQAWGAFRFRRVNISLPEDPLTMELRELDAPLPWVTSAEVDTKWALQSKRPGYQPQAFFRELACS